VARWGVECGCDAVGSGGAARWGVECRRDTVGSGGAARWGVEMVECGVTRWGLGSGVRCGRW
jgi:hypothetical protein